MAQRRMVHEKIWDCEQFLLLTITERLLYVALITAGDDEGCFRADAKYWKRKVFFDDRIGVQRIKDMLNKIQEVDLINTGETEKGLAGYHPNWHQYQTLRTERCKPSQYKDLLTANGLTPRLIVSAQDKSGEVNINKDNLSTKYSANRNPNQPESMKELLRNWKNHPKHLDDEGHEGQ